MTNITRYEIDGAHNPNPDGAWVDYLDHLATFERHESLRRALGIILFSDDLKAPELRAIARAALRDFEAIIRVEGETQ